MALSSVDSSANMPARIVQTKHLRSESQAARTGVRMPTYTIQRDAPWMSPVETPDEDLIFDEPAAPPVPRLKLPEVIEEELDVADKENRENKRSRSTRAKRHDSKAVVTPAASNQQHQHQHAQSILLDPGHTTAAPPPPHVRNARIPIFKQVRSLLYNKPSIPVDNTYNTDKMLSSTSATAHYESPFPGLRRPSPASSRSHSPVSTLHEDELRPTPPLKVGINTINSMRIAPTPVSPISPLGSNPVSGNAVKRPQVVKRKPAPARGTALARELQAENIEPQRTDSAKSGNWSETTTSDAEGQYKYTPSPESSSADLRPSATITSLPTDNTMPFNLPLNFSTSRFSWSTITSGTTAAPPSTTTTENDNNTTPPRPSPTNPSLFLQHDMERTPTSTINTTTVSALYNPPRGPPVQSILSRRRPIQRNEKEEWTPTVRIHKTRAGGDYRSVTAPLSASLIDPRATANFGDSLRVTSPFQRPATAEPKGRSVSQPPTTTTLSTSPPSSAAGKALPLPPTLTHPSEPLTHLESLLAQQKDIALQRRNAETSIASLEAVASSSPMEVTFGEVKETRERLRGYRVRLEEVLLEEREVGVKVARARAKGEGDGGLWVRRVMG